MMHLRWIDLSCEELQKCRFASAVRADYCDSRFTIEPKVTVAVKNTDRAIRIGIAEGDVCDRDTWRR